MQYTDVRNHQRFTEIVLNKDAINDVQFVSIPENETLLINHIRYMNSTESFTQ